MISSYKKDWFYFIGSWNFIQGFWECPSEMLYTGKRIVYFNNNPFKREVGFCDTTKPLYKFMIKNFS